jgi:hypothetical protein
VVAKAELFKSRLDLKELKLLNFVVVDGLGWGNRWVGVGCKGRNSICHMAFTNREYLSNQILIYLSSEEVQHALKVA